MLLGFKRRFAPFVEEGSKTHTIRGTRAIAPKVGEICHCYVDPRQKTMRLLGRWPCVRVEQIRISFRHSHLSPLLVEIDGTVLSPDETESLFVADGFGTESGHSFPATSEAAGFWKAKLAKQDFEGTLIHWDYSKPVEVEKKRLTV